MKSDVNGCSTCAAGQESFEYFNMAGKERIQYDYRTPAGLLFSTIAPSLEIAQERRDKWLRTLPQS